MKITHIRAYNFLATYIRIIREVNPPVGNDIDYFLMHLQNWPPRKAILETPDLQEIYERLDIDYSNLLTRLHRAKWSTVRDLNLYNFLAQYVYPDAYQRKPLDRKLRSTIEIPEMLLCGAQEFEYYI